MRFPIGRTVVSVPAGKAEAAVEAPLPPPGRILLNAGKAMARAGLGLIQGKLWQTPARAQAHREICESNRCGFYRASDQRCGHPNCGCFTALKTRMLTEECPAGLFHGEQKEADSA